MTALQDDFKIGDSLVQPGLNLIRSGGESTRVKPRSMAVLVELSRANGEVVRKHDLMDAVWGQSVVSEDVLTQSIVELRKAFGDSASDPNVIETIRRVGFRLLQPVTEPNPQPRNASLLAELKRRKVPGTAATYFVVMLSASALMSLVVAVSLAIVIDWQLPGGTGTSAEPSVAVLPFVNLSDESDAEYFSDGLSEEVLNTLARVPGLRVPARTSSFAFRGRDEDIRMIGRSLGVATVLEGSVRHSGQRIRVSAQLIDVVSGYEIWTQTYDRQVADVFAVQTDIANSIVDALSIQLGQDNQPELVAGTANADAYQLYMLGRHHLENELGDWIDDARSAFSRAIDTDPRFARAYTGLADTYLIYRETPGSFMQGDSMPFDEALQNAEAAIAEALALEPQLADGYISRAAVAATRSDWNAEERDLRTAIDLNPSLVRAFLGLGANLVAQRRPAEALDAYRTAATLDPLNPQAAASLARLTAALGDYESAVAYPQRLLQSGLRSPHTFEALINISRAYGRFDERVRWGRNLVRLSPTHAAGLAELADAYLELGEFDLAEQWARRAEELSPMQALKVRSRLYGVRNDTVGMFPDCSGRPCRITHHRPAIDYRPHSRLCRPWPVSTTSSPASMSSPLKPSSAFARRARRSTEGRQRCLSLR